jgi:hypothetical protein
MVVKQALTRQGGRASGQQTLSWLSGETGYKPSDLNALLAVMEREQEITRRFNTKNCLSELKLRDLSAVPTVVLDGAPVATRTTPAAAAVPAPATPQPSSNGHRRYYGGQTGTSGIIDFIKTHGQGGIYVADDAASVAQAMGISVTTLHNWLTAGRRSGQLKTTKRGGHYFVSLVASVH